MSAFELPLERTLRLALIVSSLPPALACNSFGEIGCPICETGKVHWHRKRSGLVKLRCTSRGCFPRIALPIAANVVFPKPESELHG